ncbi:MAG: ribosome biogenesis GTPase Der, partial [Ignavibacteriae bacterium]|nr:ribosome biogenesis GTPase Der [Ignavibacteriota bacterium]
FYSTLRALKSLDRCDVAILMIDAETGTDRQDLRIMANIAERDRGTVLAVNKWDLIEKDEYTVQTYEHALRKRLRVYDYVPIIFISALTKQRIFKVIDLAKTVYSEQTKRIPTNQLNKVLLKEIEATPPASSTGKEIKLNYVTQVKTNPPVITFFANEPKLIEEQYKRFLERRIRKHFGFVGVPLTLSFRKKR